VGEIVKGRKRAICKICGREIIFWNGWRDESFSMRGTYPYEHLHTPKKEIRGVRND